MFCLDFNEQNKSRNMNQVPGVLWPSSVIAKISLKKTQQAL